jgi:DNA invertase Pin-like site-specific DNA recombinase
MSFVSTNEEINDILSILPSTPTSYVVYLRVSTARQGQSGLSLEAQRQAVQQFVASRGGKVIAPEYVEVESGKVNARPQLEAAIKRCRMTGATLAVAKLDRLSRNAVFLLTLRDSGVQFVAVDMPEANTLTVGIMALMAQHEREAISARTKVALQAAKARGQQLGGHRPGSADISQFAAKGRAARVAIAEKRVELVADDLRRLRDAGLSLNAIADRLNQDGIRSAAGGRWTATAVRRALVRLAE